MLKATYGRCTNIRRPFWSLSSTVWKTGCTQESDSYGKIMKAFNSELIEMMDVAIVAADKVGKIIFANHKAYDTLLAGWNNAIGFSCENIWGIRNPVQDVYKGEKTNHKQAAGI